MMNAPRRGGKHIRYKRPKINMTDFSSETMQVRRQWSLIFKVLKGMGGKVKLGFYTQ